MAGLAAIGTASSLGAVVRAFDARPEVGEQVESMGAEFLRIDIEQAAPSADGYAKETSADFDAKAAELYAAQAADVDILITTALIPGRPAPRLITEAMVASMKPGSVVVDMAASNGGNVAGSVADQKVVTANGVTILGYTDLPGPAADPGLAAVRHQPGQPAQAGHARQGRRVHPRPRRPGAARHDRGARRRGALAAAAGAGVRRPGRRRGRAGGAEAGEGADEREPAPGLHGRSRPRSSCSSPRSRPAPFLGHFMVFMLSVVIGFYVIGNVHHALHTPLMSVTNAISGIIVVGAILQIGHGSVAVSVLAFVGILVASINVFGGFRVTARMLEMFKREEPAR